MAIRTNSTRILHGATLALLASAALTLGLSFQLDHETARALALGASWFALTVAILVFVITKLTERARDYAERLNLALTVSNDGLWDWNLRSGEFFLSPRWCQSLGLEPDEVHGSLDFWLSRVHRDGRDEARTALNALARGERDGMRLECRLLTASGAYRWNLTRARVVETDPHGQPRRVIGVDVDISRVRQLSAQIAYQASHDAITGLLNRREFERRTSEAIDQVSSGRARHALLVLNVDRFEVITESCGRAAGDELIGQVARLLQERCGAADTLARFGDDQFCLLLENCTPDAAQRVARALLAAVDEYRFHWNGSDHSMSMSAGLAIIERKGDTVTTLLRHADAACSAAQRRGRGRVRIFAPEDAELADRHGNLEWVGRINAALDEDRFELWCQPIVPVNPDVTARVHYETLVRMRDQRGDIIAPGAFLPAAEIFALTTKLDRWVLEHALAWLREHPEHVAELEMCSINLSGHSLGSEGFLDFAVDLIRDCDIPMRKLCFEITETAAIADVACATRFISALRSHGVRFALDDFGSGLSSFSYLRQLPVDLLKIDGAFVRDIDRNSVHRTMVRAVNDIGHAMGIQTVAEFVENAAVLEQLRELGVDFAQGYHLGRPRPLLELEHPAAPVAPALAANC